MLIFPKKSKVGRIMPKEAFYKHLTLKGDIREKFVSDIKRIVLEYKLSPDTLNVEKGEEVAEILVLSLELKKKELDYRTVEAIARQNSHKLLFIIKYQDQFQLSLYYKKIYKTDWIPEQDISLNMTGLNLDSVWNGLVEQVALREDIKIAQNNISVSERLEQQERIIKLQKEIDKLEKASRNEKQPKKRFELYTKLQDLRKKLEKEKGD
ncbi:MULTISPECIES: DUF4391 domain-containing protein [Bacillaceae]|uniref:DUF4391 domain-containing protein n=1 Tax=Evansella alkalicola TaxID=745819 RepID=A0ABS6JYG3_9BACI|nr:MULTISPECIES: DUF4391 domain-containing protein [Bacillaceae]MBU9723639.1 DUF4391 domain-containing protein [Bacillus alkalicola]